MPTEPLVFNALISKITSTADGGWRITLETGADEAEAVQVLIMQLQTLCSIVVQPV